MFNTKLRVLLKELPWLTALDPLITQAMCTSVERLDIHLMQSVKIGCIRGVEYPSDSHGYLVDKNGKLVGNVHIPEVGIGKFRGLLKRIAARIAFDSEVFDARSVAEATCNLTGRDEIRFVVVVEQMYYSKEVIDLKVWKLPKEKTMSDLLEDLRISTEAERSAKQEKVEAEIGSVLSS